MCADETEGRPPLDEARLQAMEATVREIRRYESRPHCKRCRIAFDPIEEAANLRKGWCFSCEWNWLEPRIERLVYRIGRKAALQAIRRVTR